MIVHVGKKVEEKIRMRRGTFTLLVLGILSLGIIYSNHNALASICNITPVYQGPTQAVIVYAFDGAPNPTSLMATLPGGGMVTVAGPATSGGSRFQHTGLSYGDII